MCKLCDSHLSLLSDDERQMPMLKMLVLQVVRENPQGLETSEIHGLVNEKLDAMKIHNNCINLIQLR